MAPDPQLPPVFAALLRLQVLGCLEAAWYQKQANIEASNPCKVPWKISLPSSISKLLFIRPSHLLVPPEQVSAVSCAWPSNWRPFGQQLNESCIAVFLCRSKHCCHVKDMKDNDSDRMISLHDAASLCHLLEALKESIVEVLGCCGSRATHTAPPSFPTKWLMRCATFGQGSTCYKTSGASLCGTVRDVYMNACYENRDGSRFVACILNMPRLPSL